MSSNLQECPAVLQPACRSWACDCTVCHMTSLVCPAGWPCAFSSPETLFEQTNSDNNCEANPMRKIGNRSIPRPAQTRACGVQCPSATSCSCPLSCFLLEMKQCVRHCVPALDTHTTHTGPESRSWRYTCFFLLELAATRISHSGPQPMSNFPSQKHSVHDGRVAKASIL